MKYIKNYYNVLVKLSRERTEKIASYRMIVITWVLSFVPRYISLPLYVLGK